jgi:isopenicillin-N epimerase
MRRPPEDLEAKLLQVSDQLTGTGLDVSVDDVAQMSGIPRATLYYYFSGKDDLVDFFLNDKLSRTGEAIAKAAAGEGSATARMRAVLIEVLRALAAHPVLCVELPVAIRDSGSYEQVVASAQRLVMAPLRELLIEGRATGEFAVADVDTTAIALMGALNMVGMMQTVQTGLRRRCHRRGPRPAAARRAGRPLSELPAGTAPMTPDLWALDPEVDYLNHGAFGARLVAVLEAQAEWRRRLDENPTRFMTDVIHPAIAASRGELAAFLGAHPDRLAFVRNATEGANAILGSLTPRLHPGDEILVTDHGYNAVTNAARMAADRSGAVVVPARIPFPIEAPEQAVAAVLGAVTDRTRLAIIDHITSPTALVLPIAGLVAALEPDVPVLADLAHAPGMVAVALEDLGASYATGNCHKWLCAPVGAGFVHLRADRVEEIAPPVISHGYNMDYVPGQPRFQAMFDWTGTADYSAWVMVGEAIRVMATLHPDGWPGVMAANRALALAGRDVLAARLGLTSAAPDGMIGAMAALGLPGDAEGEGMVEPLTDELARHHQIEVPVFGWGEPRRRVLRISAQRYNRIEQYERLAEVLQATMPS